MRLVEELNAHFAEKGVFLDEEETQRILDQTDHVIPAIRKCSELLHLTPDNVWKN